MFEFIDLTEATTGQALSIRAAEIKMLCSTPIGTQVSVGNYTMVVRDTVEEIKAKLKAVKLF
jgi:hypothetical protein